MEPSDKLDVWIARNLGFIAVLQIVISFAGPFLFGLMAIAYTLMKLRYWSFHSGREAIFSVLAAILLLVAPFLIVQYWRYPRLAFRMGRTLFWLCSAAYVPAWILVLLFSREELAMPAWHLLHGYEGVLFAGLILPAVHFVLSIGGLYASRARTASPGDAANRDKKG